MRHQKSNIADSQEMSVVTKPEAATFVRTLIRATNTDQVDWHRADVFYRCLLDDVNVGFNAERLYVGSGVYYLEHELEQALHAAIADYYARGTARDLESATAALNERLRSDT